VTPVERPAFEGQLAKRGTGGARQASEALSAFIERGRRAGRGREGKRHQGGLKREMILPQTHSGARGSSGQTAIDWSSLSSHYSVEIIADAAFAAL
jgi:hypothetical protein